MFLCMCGGGGGSNEHTTAADTLPPNTTTNHRGLKKWHRRPAQQPTSRSNDMAPQKTQRPTPTPCSRTARGKRTGPGAHNHVNHTEETPNDNKTQRPARQLQGTQRNQRRNSKHMHTIQKPRPHTMKHEPKQKDGRHDKCMRQKKTKTPNHDTNNPKNARCYNNSKP